MLASHPAFCYLQYIDFKQQKAWLGLGTRLPKYSNNAYIPPGIVLPIQQVNDIFTQGEPGIFSQWGSKQQKTEVLGNF